RRPCRARSRRGLRGERPQNHRHHAAHPHPGAADPRRRAWHSRARIHPALPGRPQMNAVAAAGVWKYYGDYPALRNLRLTARPGSCLALTGRNGAGKTPLLRPLAGFSHAGKGEIRIFGGAPRDTATRRAIGYIGHGISVYDELSALENLTLFGRLY